jgi:hypothetical protein
MRRLCQRIISADTLLIIVCKHDVPAPVTDEPSAPVPDQQLALIGRKVRKHILHKTLTV